MASFPIPWVVLNPSYNIPIVALATPTGLFDGQWTAVSIPVVALSTPTGLFDGQWTAVSIPVVALAP